MPSARYGSILLLNLYFLLDNSDPEGVEIYNSPEWNSGYK
jgi:hypothetical protein